MISTTNSVSDSVEFKQKNPRKNGCNVLVDTALQPYPDQWEFIANIQTMPVSEIEPTILRWCWARTE
jgi:hypothetical protein